MREKENEGFLFHLAYGQRDDFAALQRRGQPSFPLACQPLLAGDPNERRLERETGIEPATNSLEGCDSTTELLPPSRLTRPPIAASAGEPAIRQLAGQPKLASASEGWWRGKDSNLRSR